MKDIISVNIATDLNHTFECDSNILGREGEGNTTQLQLTIPEALLNRDVYLEFEKPNKERIRTSKLEIEKGVAFYDVPQYVLAEDGEISVQAIFEKENGSTWKSSIKKFFATKSINAVDDIPDKEDFISKAQKVLDELSGEVEEIANLLLGDEDFVDSIRDSIEEATSVKTITGSRLKFFVGTKKDYEALKDKENLFAIITDDTAKAELESDIKELQEDLNLLGEAFYGHTHNGLLCSVEFANGTARLLEADANELKNKMCFLVFEEVTDLSKRLHSGVFYIANDVNIDDATQPEHTYSVDYGDCGQYRLAYYPTATYTDPNMKLWDKDGELANVNGTLYIHRLGVI